jgi:hypothetical protein
VGKVCKVLFGTMDEDDAECYNDQRELSERNSNSLTLLKQQRTVVSSVLGVVNVTSSDRSYNENKVNGGLKQLLHYVDSVVSQYRYATNLLSMKITLENRIARVLCILSVLQRNYDILISNVVSTHQGIFHPQTESPHLIIEASVRSSPSFPPDTSLRFTIRDDSSCLFYGICEE